MQDDEQSEIESFLLRVQQALENDPRYEPPSRPRRDATRPRDTDMLTIRTAEELVAEAGRLPPMLVEGLLPHNSLFLLTGKPKAGKSFLALDIADSVRRGAPALGELRVNGPGTVLYVALEDGPIELARRLTQRGILPPEPQNTSNPPPNTPTPENLKTQTPQPPEHQTTQPPDPAAPASLCFITDSFCLTEPKHLARFVRQARSLQPVLIVIDTAAEALDIRDWNNRAEILAKIAPIRRLARDLCTVLLVAHNRKAEGDMGDEIAGSNALAGAVDGWISAHRVERRENGNRRLFLRVEGRGGVGQELAAEMDHRTLAFSLIPPEQREADAAAARRTAAMDRRAERHEQTRAALYSLGGRATISELAAAMGTAYKIAWSLVREMVALGEIEEQITSARTPGPDGIGRPAPIYSLPNTGP